MELAGSNLNSLTFAYALLATSFSVVGGMFETDGSKIGKRQGQLKHCEGFIGDMDVWAAD